MQFNNCRIGLDLRMVIYKMFWDLVNLMATHNMVLKSQESNKFGRLIKAAQFASLPQVISILFYCPFGNFLAASPVSVTTEPIRSRSCAMLCHEFRVSAAWAVGSNSSGQLAGGIS